MSKSFWKVYFLRIYFLDFKGCQKSTRKVSSLKLYRQISVDVKSTSLKSALSRNPDYHHYNELNKRSLFTGWLHLCGRQIHLCGWQIPLSWNCVVAGGYRWRQIISLKGGFSSNIFPKSRYFRSNQVLWRICFLQIWITKCCQKSKFQQHCYSAHCSSFVTSVANLKLHQKNFCLANKISFCRK